jgi:quercetin dioxygenase-like cupin family protein
MKNKYLIRMEEPEDCVIVTDNADVYYRLFHRPVTLLMKNEFDCMQFHTPSSKPIDYHEHSCGTETFIVSQGKFLCNCMGRDFIMSAGDVLHIQPWMGHGFKPIEPESRLNILFMGIDQRFSITEPTLRLKAEFPGLYEDSEFNEVFRQALGGTGKRAVPAPNEASAEQVQQLRPAGYAIREHEFDGIKLQLKVARYETEGVKEIWEMAMEPGFFCEWDNFLPEYRMFYVTSGRIRCKVKTSRDKTLEFDAVKENIIIIPPYNPFCFEVVEEARMYDLDCGARLQDLCEELEALVYYTPEKKNDKESILALCKTFGFNCTDVGRRAPG